jgi:GPH family glycoside/pentoside/hexuronide:cation symporter
MVFVTLSYMLFDTFSTLVSIPFLSLTPELAPDYDSRTTLSGFRTIFQLAASLSVVVAAPLIVDGAVALGFTQQQGFMCVAAIFGTTGAVPFLVIALVVRETAAPQAELRPSMLASLRAAWLNIPFRFALGMHLLNWAAVDTVAIMIPYFLLYWVSQGNLLAKVSLFGTPLALESVFFGLLMLSCILSLPLWLWFARRRNKQQAYLVGMSVFLVVEASMFLVRPGQMTFTLVLAVLAGIGIATAYVLPESIFPDILEWDELRTRRRQEGVYYGVRAFVRKLTTGLTMFAALQFLGWSGYRTPPEGVSSFQQSVAALTAIRILVSPVGATMLIAALALAWFYPLTRERHARIHRLLNQRKAGRQHPGNGPQGTDRPADPKEP